MNLSSLLLILKSPIMINSLEGYLLRLKGFGCEKDANMIQHIFSF